MVMFLECTRTTDHPKTHSKRHKEHAKFTWMLSLVSFKDYNAARQHTEPQVIFFLVYFFHHFFYVESIQVHFLLPTMTLCTYTQSIFDSKFPGRQPNSFVSQQWHFPMSYHFKMKCKNFTLTGCTSSTFGNLPKMYLSKTVNNCHCSWYYLK